MYKFSTLSNPANLRKIRAKIKNIANKAGFNKKDALDIVLAVDEACTNIIRHSYKNDFSKKINIDTDIKNKKLTINIRSYGVKPELKKIKGSLPKKLRPGGLGIFFIKKIMDNVIYDTSRKRATKLTLIKNLQKG